MGPTEDRAPQIEGFLVQGLGFVEVLAALGQAAEVMERKRKVWVRVVIAHTLDFEGFTEQRLGSSVVASNIEQGRKVVERHRHGWVSCPEVVALDLKRPR